VTDYAAAANTADKVLPSSLVSDRVNAVYSFISANPFDEYVPRCLIIVCVCLPATSYATTVPAIPPTVYLFAARLFGRPNITHGRAARR